MGKSTVVAYVVEMVERAPNGNTSKVHMAFNEKVYGKASEASLEKFAMAYIKSLQPGGVNYHISQSCGFIPNISKATLIGQVNGNRFEWKAPMFMVV